MLDTIAIVLKVGSLSFQAMLYNNPTAQSLAGQMPFTVAVKDYAGIEKIFYPETPLNKNGAPVGADPAVGDIMYYAPWGDVAIFYQDFGYASGLIPLGRLENVAGFVQALASESAVTFEKTNK
ncbi:MAG: hypothetical protein H6569_05115 [Lewinellaceae bacterium]|nr:hypothetical protein [Lewinellaceae bacterium]